MYEKDFTVEYVDVDVNNKLSNFGFFKYLQEIACLHADACEYGLNSVYKTRVAWILLDWKLNIFSRPSWNSSIHIKTWPSQMDFVSCYRDFEITGMSGEIIATATSRWVLVNIDSKHMSKIAPEVIEAFGACQESACEDKIEKIKEPETYEKSLEYTIMKRDIDTNRHLNNLNYILLASELLPDNTYYSKIDVMYKKQCFLGDSVLLKSHMDNGECVVSVKSADDSVLHAIVRFKV